MNPKTAAAIEAVAKVIEPHIDLWCRSEWLSMNVLEALEKEGMVFKVLASDKWTPVCAYEEIEL